MHLINWYYNSVFRSMSTVFFTSCFVILFSSLWRSRRICEPHFRHFILKSIPTYMTSNLFPPHGCGFFSSIVSPTFIFIGILSHLRKTAAMQRTQAAADHFILYYMIYDLFLLDLVAAHERSENFRDSYRTVLILVVLKYSSECSAYCQT